MPKPIEHRRREPAPAIFRLVLPLPFPGLDRVNAYVLAGDEPMLVDCGIYLPDPADHDHGWDHVVAALDTCGMKPGDVKTLLITHPHIDHYGMAGRFVAETGCELWMHEESQSDLEVYRNPQAVIDRLKAMFADHGVSGSDVDELVAYEDWRSLVSDVIEPTRALAGGERFKVGEREWEIVYTPGHSRAHVCLWSAADRILISGDHLLPTITPHIDFKRGEDEDPLGDFLESLATVERLDPALVLAGARTPFRGGGRAGPHRGEASRSAAGVDPAGDPPAAHDGRPDHRGDLRRRTIALPTTPRLGRSPGPPRLPATTRRDRTVQGRERGLSVQEGVAKAVGMTRGLPILGRHG